MSTAVIKHEADLYELFMNQFLNAGMAMNEADNYRACRQWISLGLSHEDQVVIVADVEAKIRSGEWGSAKYMPRPWRYLYEKQWTRRAVPRTYPTVRHKTWGDLEHERAGQEFLKRRKA